MGKIVSLSAIRNYVKPWTASVIPGSFDLLHVGHIRAIKRSSECTRPMVVVLSSDSRLRQRKGGARPIINETQRLEMVSALACVDYVVPWKELSHDAYLRAILPRRITFEKHAERLGTEYFKRIQHVATEYRPTEILMLPRTEGVSTTHTIATAAQCREQERQTHGIHEHPKTFHPRPGQIDYTHVRWTPIVNCVVKCEERILIVQRSPAMRICPGSWNGIAGYLDDQLSVTEKVVEELYEELGLRADHITRIRKGNVFLQEDDANAKTCVNPVLVEVDTQEVQINWEASDYRWIHPNELDQFPLYPGFRDVVQQAMG